MASTYSDLKIELIGTGEQAGTWGTTTNTNLSTALGEAITGSANVAFSSADVTITLTNTNASQTARNLRLVCTGTSGGARNLILGSGCQIEKLYLIQNDLADAVTVKNTTGTGVTVPAGRSQFVFNDGTNVVEATNGIIDLTTDVTGTLPVTNGGTGQTSYTNGELLIGNTTGNTLTKATLTGTADRLTVTNGSGSITLNVDATDANTANKVVARDGSGNFSAGTITANLTGNVTGNVTGDVTGNANNVTGTVAVANGGTGQTTLTANNLLAGNGTSAVNFIAAGTSGNVLTSDGTSWSSQPISAGGNYELVTFTSPGTWTKDANLKAVKVTLIGGGGGGGGVRGGNPPAISRTAGSGGGGGVSVKYIPAPSIPGPVVVTCGTGGAGGPGPPSAGAYTAGGTGGTSSFGSFFSATGGGGGAQPTGAGGIGSGGDLDILSGRGNSIGGAQGGGNSLFNYSGGANGQGTPIPAVPARPGGIPATGQGCGGGGAISPPAATIRAGGAGSGGIVIVEEFY